MIAVRDFPVFDSHRHAPLDRTAMPLMRRLIHSTVVGFLILAVAGRLNAGQPLTSERILPKRTLALVKIPSAAEFRRKWNGSSFGAMQRDPAFQPFFADLERQVDRLTAGVKRTLGVGVKQVWNSLEGEAAVGLIHSPESGLALVGVVEVGADEAAAAQRVAALNAALAAGGARDVRLKAGETDVVSWTAGTDDDPFKFSFFRRGTHLVVCQDLNALLTVAAAAKKGPSETLAANPVYQYIVDQTRPSSGEPALQWYVDPVGALGAAIGDNLQDNPNRELIIGLLSKAGIDKFKGIGGTVELASAFADNVSRVFGYVEPPASGLLQAFALPATPQSPPEWVPDDANLYMQVNWSGPRFYQAIETFFDSFQGQGAFNALVGSGRLPGTETTFREAMSQLTGPIDIAACLPTSSGELLKQSAVFAIRVRDSTKAEAMLKAIGDASGAQPKTVNGVPTYSLRLGLPTGGQSVEIGFSVAKGSLMVSTSPSYLESVVARRKGKPLAQSPTFKAATGQFPAKTSVLSYSRQDRRFELLYEEIRSGDFKLPLYGGIVTGLSLDFSKLPPAKAIRPYLQTSAGFIEPADKGFRMIDIGYWPQSLQEPARKRGY
jgi:hypothetical protein